MKGGCVEPAGVEVPIQWRGRLASAFVPTRLAERNLTLTADTVARAARAQAGVEHGPSRLYTSAELLGLTGSNPLRA
jgi:hypothetical protein